MANETPDTPLQTQAAQELANRTTQTAPTGALQGGPPPPAPNQPPVSGAPVNVLAAPPPTTPTNARPSVADRITGVTDRVANFISGGQQTPGSVWRGILGGALTGMAAGPGAATAKAAVSAGGAAAIKQQQTQFQEQIEASREKSEQQYRNAQIALTNHNIWMETQKLQMAQAEASISHAQSETNLVRMGLELSGESKDLGVFQTMNDDEIQRLRAQHPEWAKDMNQGNIFTTPHYSEVQDAKGNITWKYDGVHAIYVPPDVLRQKTDHDIDIQKFVPGTKPGEGGHWEPDVIKAGTMTNKDALAVWQKQQELMTKYDNESLVTKANAAWTAAQANLERAKFTAEMKQMMIDQAANDGRDIVNLDLTPNLVPRRGETWELVRAATDKASFAKNGKPFDWAKADADFAESGKYRPVLDYMTSLTGPNGTGGTLAQLKRYSDSISRTDFPGLNQVERWAEIEKGDPMMTVYHNFLTTEVADQIAKIIQGGGTGSASTDTKLQQAQAMLNSGFNKQTMDQMIGAIREALNNRKNGLISNNMFLWKWYGPQSALARNASPTGEQLPTSFVPPGGSIGIPPGAAPVFVKDKQIGYHTPEMKPGEFIRTAPDPK